MEEEPAVIDVADDSSFVYVGFDTANSIKRYSLPALGLRGTNGLVFVDQLGRLIILDGPFVTQ